VNLETEPVEHRQVKWFVMGQKCLSPHLWLFQLWLKEAWKLGGMERNSFWSRHYLSKHRPLALEKESECFWAIVHGKQLAGLRQCTKEGWEATQYCAFKCSVTRKALKNKISSFNSELQYWFEFTGTCRCSSYANLRKTVSKKEKNTGYVGWVSVV